jgi:hypothetical protein
MCFSFVLGSVAKQEQVRLSPIEPSAKPIGVAIEVMTISGLSRLTASGKFDEGLIEKIGRLNPGWIAREESDRLRSVLSPGLLVLPDWDNPTVGFAWYRCDERPVGRRLPAEVVEDIDEIFREHMGDGGLHGLFITTQRRSGGDDAVWYVRTVGSTVARSAIQFDSARVFRPDVWAAVAGAGAPTRTAKIFK